MTEEVKEIIESEMKSDKGRIISPEKNQVCLYKTKDKQYPVKVIKGQFYGEHGVSNFWYWINLNTNEEERGYGYFYEMGEAE